YGGGAGETQNAVDNTNRRLERGPSSFDIRQRVSLFYVLELPSGPGHRLFGWNNGWNRQILGGCQISGIATLQTGAPFTVVSAMNGPDASGFNTGGGPGLGGWADRPDVTRSGPLPQNNRNPDRAFDTTYFRPGPA